MKSPATNRVCMVSVVIGFLAFCSQAPQASAELITVSADQWKDYLRHEARIIEIIGEQVDNLKANARTRCPIGGPGDERVRRNGEHKSLWNIIEAFKHILKQFDEARWALRWEMRNTCPWLVPKLHSGTANVGLPIVILTEEEIDAARFPNEAAQLAWQIGDFDWGNIDWPNLDFQQRDTADQEENANTSRQNGDSTIQDPTARQQTAVDQENDSVGWGNQEPENGGTFPQARPEYESWIKNILDKWGCEDMMDLELRSQAISELIHYAEAVRTAMLHFSLQFDNLSGVTTGEAGATRSENLVRLARQMEAGKITGTPAQNNVAVTYNTRAREQLVIVLLNATKRLHKEFFAINRLRGDIELFSYVPEFIKLVSGWNIPNAGEDDRIMNLFEGLNVWHQCWRKPLQRMAGTMSGNLGPPPDPSSPKWGRYPPTD
ncbi:hypothetical protein TWF481_005128 [Arthrobotrys musiformis]|uniref:Secreted protein n=1 Tax=Arthrobotrys musiformis TaxID=47236 RepID=A0AAV9WEA8_9PEZI